MTSPPDNSYPPLFRQIQPNPIPRTSEDEISLHIPVIDLESLDDDALAAACRDYGLIRLENHGIPSDLSMKLQNETARLLSLSFEEKESRFHGSPVSYFWGTPAMRSLRSVNWVEGLHIPMDQLRSDVDSSFSSFRSLGAEYGEHMARIARKKSFDAVARDLKLDSSQLGSYLDESHGILRVYRYPLCPDVGNYFGMDTHTDSSVWSILNQDSVGGLQILHGNQWLHVPPVPGSIIVNVGDMLQAISNDKYKSVQHRVLANGDKERMSLCYFAFPREGGVIKSSNYRPFTYQDFNAQVQQDVKDFGFKVGLERFRIKSQG
ncbi:gibberellin 2-beta-dioxygenase 8-like [Dioscorea cayenensis subsp. rotundata]|uniref:Gibberellin 2-beta-dioxygenase 8-like n=1 Tax=Dioscorea cayennensis subsp. rotundata TaxID=55577 RepID=A0AB40BMI4_DIOCR|nr:gibberellin 2-beta-dioxygenase 8-like [Dioscorea cayenensis subsp. rotundata]